MSLRLKKTRCRGWSPNGDPEFVYIKVGNLIFFSSIEDVKASSINAAEHIIRTLCQEEGISWKDYTFFDIQTPSGYSNRPKGWYEIDRLRISSSEDRPDMNVDGWIPIQNSSGKIPKWVSDQGLYIPVPDEVLDLFAPYINVSSKAKDIYDPTKDPLNWGDNALQDVHRFLILLCNTFAVACEELEGSGSLSTAIHSTYYLVKFITEMFRMFLSNEKLADRQRYMATVLTCALDPYGLVVLYDGMPFTDRDESACKVEMPDRTRADRALVPLDFEVFEFEGQWTREDLYRAAQILRQFQHSFTGAASRSVNRNASQLCRDAEHIFRSAIMIAETEGEGKNPNQHRSYIANKIDNGLYWFKSIRVKQVH